MLDLSKYSKIQFKDKGRSYDGCDCWGIPFLIYKHELGIELASFTDDYHNTEDAKQVASLMNAHRNEWKEVKTPVLFDLVNMRLSGQPMHVGVYIGGGLFIHCIKGSGTVIEKLDSLMWRNRIVGYYRRK